MTNNTNDKKNTPDNSPKNTTDQHTLRTGQGNGVLGQREGKGGNRAQPNPDKGHDQQRSS